MKVIIFVFLLLGMRFDSACEDTFPSLPAINVHVCMADGNVYHSLAYATCKVPELAQVKVCEDQMQLDNCVAECARLAAAPDSAQPQAQEQDQEGAPQASTAETDPEVQRSEEAPNEPV